MEEQSVSFDLLPRQCLDIILRHVFSRYTDQTPDWPLMAAARQWAVLSLVTKHLAEVLEDVNPPIKALRYSNIPYINPALEKWFCARTIESVELSDPTLSDDRYNDTSSEPDMSTLNLDSSSGPAEYCIFLDLLMLIGPGSFARRDPSIRWQPNTSPTDVLARGNISTLPVLQGLKYLKIKYPDLWCYDCRFNVSVLSSLPVLHTLSLSGFKDYTIESLPSSLKVLELEYGEQWDVDVLSSHGINIITSLPDGTKLDRLVMKKLGVLGIELSRVWDHCKEIEIEAQYVLVGVAVSDQDLVADFRRPYAEGDYIPPHILGDWNQVEQSNQAAESSVSYLFTGLAQCKGVESIRFKGPCSKSIKLIPGHPDNLNAVKWIHSVVQQAPHFLYGMSGAELLDRLIDMRARGSIPSEPGQVVVKRIEAEEDGQPAQIVEIKRVVTVQLSTEKREFEIAVSL